MLLTIHYCPEMGIWTIHNGRQERVVTPDELTTDRWAPVAPLLEKAKQAVTDGKAVCGLSVEV